MVSTKAAPVRRPGGRRPIPPLVFLLVLALLALVVWLKVLQKDETDQAKNSQECVATPSAEVVKTLSNLKNVRIKVLNGSGIKGLAGALQAELTGRGFTIVSIGNAEQNNAMAGEIHYGPKGAFAARVIAKHAGGFELVQDGALPDATIEIVPGEAYKGLVEPKAAAAQVKTVITAEAEAEAKTEAGCAGASS